MEARFISNDIIDGRSIDTYVVTFQGLYLATIHHEDEPWKNETVDVIDNNTIRNIVGFTSGLEDFMYACVDTKAMRKS